MPSSFSRSVVAGLCLLALLVPVRSARAAGQPISIKELCLMLRGGYTGDEVLRETAGRPLSEPLDPDTENTLRAAGADARLLTALRANGTASASRAAAPAPSDPPAGEPSMDDARFSQWARKLRNELVVYQDGGWQRYRDSTLAGKQLFAIYFAAQNDPRSQQFTPRLVQFYRQFAPQHPPFELLFFSMDPSAELMENDVRQNAMPWPVVPYDHLAGFTNIMPFGRQGLPRLLVADGQGRVLLDSFVNGAYVGPQHVLDELTRMTNAAAVNVTAASAPHAPFAPGAASPGPARAGRPGNPRFMADLLRGKLVSLHNGTLQPLNGSALDDKKLIGLFFSSYMSRKGHEFSPELAAFYRRMRSSHPEFEIVLVSGDKSPYEMDNLMHRDDQPWPAIAYDQIEGITMVQRFIDHTAASRLMMVDNTGWVMADYRISVVNNNVPMVLPDLEKVVANPTVVSALAPPQTAAAPGAGGSIGSVQ